MDWHLPACVLAFEAVLADEVMTISKTKNRTCLMVDASDKHSGHDVSLADGAQRRSRI
jgi:hypothetical protein